MVHSDKMNNGRHLDSEQSPIEFDASSLFLNIKTDVQLADYLEVDLKKLYFLLYKAKERYVQFEIPKKSGGSRKIQAPILPLREIQYRIAAALEEIYSPTRYTHGYVKSRSIVTNASKHAGRQFLLSIDIKDFFPSINFGRVYGLFKAYPFDFPNKVATLLAQVCTHENQLPQGAPTSPLISNMICRRLDRGIEKLCRKNKVRYTRYADDLSFSWNDKAAGSELLEGNSGTPILSARLKELFEKNGFEINYTKIHLQTHLERQIVTGIKVNNETLNLRRTFPRKIRAMLHAWKKYGFELAQQDFRDKYQNKHRYPSSPEPRLDHVIKGKLNYMRMVCGPEHSTYKSLLKQFNALTDQINHETIHNKIPDSLWVIVNESTCEQGTAFLLDGYGLVTCAHVLEGGNEVYAFKANNPDERFAVIPKRVDPVADIALIGIALTRSAISLSPDFEWDAQVGKKITVAGYPNYANATDHVFIDRGEVVQIRALPRTKTKWIVVNAKIVGGNSGGPVLNNLNKVVGVVVTGAQSFKEADRETSLKHGFVPISLLRELS